MAVAYSDLYTQASSPLYNYAILASLATAEAPHQLPRVQLTTSASVAARSIEAGLSVLILYQAIGYDDPYNHATPGTTVKVYSV